MCLCVGPAKKTRVPDEETNQLTAFHEAGHTLVAIFTKDATALNKVTIIPRGGSLGHVGFDAIFVESCKMMDYCGKCPLYFGVDPTHSGQISAISITLYCILLIFVDIRRCRLVVSRAGNN